MIEDVGALKPTVFAGVPRVYDRVHAGWSKFQNRDCYMILLELITKMSVCVVPRCTTKSDCQWFSPKEGF